jgi:GMC oxidoreductase
MRLDYPITKPLHQALIDHLNLKLDSSLPSTQWEWGRIGSAFRDPNNYNFAAGAYSPIDKLLEAAMNDPKGGEDLNFRTILGAPVVRLEPQPVPDQLNEATHVVVQDGDTERKIKCKKAVVCAGSIESSAILLRSVDGDLSKYGEDFKTNFGHITDHLVLSVAKPFFYLNMEDQELIGGMKLQTDIKFDLDDTVALANIALDTVSFLPRNDVSHGLLPLFVVAYIIPSALVKKNSVELNSDNEPQIHYSWEDDPRLEDKKKVMEKFTVDIMNKVVDVFHVRFVNRTSAGYQPILHKITVGDIELKPSKPGFVAHELGTIPMPDASGSGGLLDINLHMKYGWNNVSVCDLSIFPYSAAANPSLTLAALALRLADNLYPDPKPLPTTVYNLTHRSVTVDMITSRRDHLNIGPKQLVMPPGTSATWQIENMESLHIRSCKCAESFDVRMVYPSTNTMIVDPPPQADRCSCNVQKHIDPAASPLSQFRAWPFMNGTHLFTDPLDRHQIPH